MTPEEAAARCKRLMPDYTLAQTIYTAGWCVGYMDASKHREPPSAGGPRVHEAPGGLTR